MPRFVHYSDIENVYDDPERAGRLAGLISDLDGADAAVVGSGDNTSPGVAATVSKGRQAVDFFGAVGTDVETFGNHDFDFGTDATRAIVADSPQTWVSANVRDESGEPFGEAEGVVPWTVERVDGDRVGFLGVTDPNTDSLNPSAAEMTFTDPYEAARDAVAAMEASVGGDGADGEGIDYVVAVSHLGGGDDDLARVDGVDLVLGGHIHSERAEEVDGVLCTRPGVNGETVLEVTLDDDGASVRRHSPADAPVDDRLADGLRERITAAGLDEVVGRVDEPIVRTDETVHGGECRLGNLVADAYRWAADADVGLQNAGGLRLGDDLVGDVTLADLLSVLPFEEPVVVVELTGAELRAAFAEMSASVVDFGEDDWWHGHLSGARVVWDDEREELVDASVGGDAIDPDRLYRVATPGYLLHSDHEFPTIEERHRAGEHGIQHEVLAEYVREHGVAPEIDGRIRRVATGDAREATPGDSSENAPTDATAGAGDPVGDE
ncbi:bifunctional metallophosphatase/5'-nucleotidase [Halobaculum gomorrense]|uniref:2',3'-cyclic-nucleotide 2'-phosphodiesterase/5'-or 3'-nucleotidase, 5'-nucleotidase family n=1 Tax=Halobaculum gomorrense TaxID=43928 RepID=A0A1M5SI45_9EURY|nr:5'-nucleotidase C-terminal domain-containing protein [Halobaculum gomorrense]SHH37563.1 2',3'-cyclic-nucleotide 2'-phosphodiesterase/5'-or 3'-nucleotidase, 5'-nucleotidase family [Halobaculum gomorrense]